MDANEQAQVDKVMGQLRARGASCGDCNLCCTIMAVDMAPLPEPNKPARARCGHMCKAGCSIYDAKPDSCSAFICFWLASQLFQGGMPLAWRPDKVGAVIDVQHKDTVAVKLKHENAWRRPGPLRDMIMKLANEQNALTGLAHIVLEAPSGAMFLIRPGGTVLDLVKHSENADGSFQWRTKYPEEL